MVILLENNLPRQDGKLAHLMKTGGMTIKNYSAIFTIKNNVFCIFLVDKNMMFF